MAWAHTIDPLIGCRAASPRRQLVTRQKKITLGEMRAMGVRGLLVYCADYKCAHMARITGDRWPIISVCPILKSHSSAKRAVPWAPISGRTSIGTKSLLQADPPAPSHPGQSRIKRDEAADNALPGIEKLSPCPQPRGN